MNRRAAADRQVEFEVVEINENTTIVAEVRSRRTWRFPLRTISHVAIQRVRRRVVMITFSFTRSGVVLTEYISVCSTHS